MKYLLFHDIGFVVPMIVRLIRKNTFTVLRLAREQDIKRYSFERFTHIHARRE